VEADRPALSRRSLLTAGLVAGAASTVQAAGLLASPAGAAPAGPLASPAGAAPAGPLRSDPFTLGVASGDPDHDGFVLWTRLATQPLAEDGMGGMPNRPVVVSWELATDPRFRRLVRRGSTPARPEWGHSVHVELSGLPADGEYWYRFKADGYVSPAGRTRTAPARNALAPALRMAFVSCSQYEHGYFTAYRRLAEDHPDLVLHLGDYQYEYRAGDYVSGFAVMQRPVPRPAARRAFRPGSAGGPPRVDIGQRSARAVA
jgi:alkaline phosphatase D